MSAPVSLLLSEHTPSRLFSLSELPKVDGDRCLGDAGVSTFIYEIMLILHTDLREKDMMRGSVLQR